MKVEDLVRKYEKQVFNLAFRITFSMEDAEDITQETFFTVYQKVDQFRAESHILTWIYKITLNLSLRYKSRADRNLMENLHEEVIRYRDNLPEELKDWETTPEKQYLVDELIREIRQECTYFLTFTLTEDQRITYILRTILGLSMNEIAKILEIDESGVKSRLFRARQNLFTHFRTECRWLNPDSSCDCRNRFGFALHYVPQILDRVLKTADPHDNGIIAEELAKLPGLYEKFDALPLFDRAGSFTADS